MKTKLIFLAVFVPLHSLVSASLLHLCFNPPASGHSVIFKILTMVVASPLLLPLVMFDPDGESLPRWIQVIPYPLNSLIWGLAALWMFALVKRWQCGNGPDKPEDTPRGF